MGAAGSVLWNHGRTDLTADLLSPAEFGLARPVWLGFTVQNSQLAPLADGPNHQASRLQ